MSTSKQQFICGQMRLAIPYYRVSTRAQGRSGLGLEAQRESVTRYLAQEGYEAINEYTEIESGRRKNRPALQQALKECKQKRAVLIIAKLDRLARNVFFISSLIEAKAEFIALDNPQANKLMLHMLAAFAEHESDLIRIRIKEALAASKKRGTILGKHGRVLAEINKQQAGQFAMTMKPILDELQNSGAVSIRKKVQLLNKRGIPSFRGKTWHRTSLNRLLLRLK